MVFDNIQVTTEDERYMLEALREAAKAAEQGDVPVGAVIVKNGEIISRAHNRVEAQHSSQAHAEMIAIAEAERLLGAKWLTDCVMYVTLEPCSMCAGAMVLARMKRLVIGTEDPKTGACGSLLNVADNDGLNHRLEMTVGVLKEECSAMLKFFFRNRRGKE